MHFLIKFREAFNDHKIPFINEELKSSQDDRVVKLPELRRVLEDFDAQLIYGKIYCDLTNKYNLAKEYYKVIEELRKNLVRQRNAPSGLGKKMLAMKLDVVVTSMRTDFNVFAEEKYQLLDEIFFMETNRNWGGTIDEITKKVDAVLHKPEAIYNEEFDKMCKIHDILEEEERRLQKIKNGD